MSFLSGNDSMLEFGNTHVLSFGPKGADHDVVLRLIDADMKLLQDGTCPLMYHGSLKEMVQPVLNHM